MKLSITNNNPLSAKGEERVALEESRGESMARVYYHPATIQPIFATLDHPLFPARKEGNAKHIFAVNEA